MTPGRPSSPGCRSGLMILPSLVIGIPSPDALSLAPATAGLSLALGESEPIARDAVVTESVPESAGEAPKLSRSPLKSAEETAPDSPRPLKSTSTRSFGSIRDELPALAAEEALGPFAATGGLLAEVEVFEGVFGAAALGGVLFTGVERFAADDDVDVLTAIVPSLISKYAEASQDLSSNSRRGIVKNVYAK